MSKSIYIKLSQKEINANNLKQNPDIYIKNSSSGKRVWAETVHGSFVDLSEYGMTQQKNAMSSKELIKYGYKKQKK